MKVVRRAPHLNVLSQGWSTSNISRIKTLEIGMWKVGAVAMDGHDGMQNVQSFLEGK